MGLLLAALCAWVFDGQVFLVKLPPCGKLLQFSWGKLLQFSLGKLLHCNCYNGVLWGIQLA